MTNITTLRRGPTRDLLRRLVDAPDLVAVVRAMPAERFASAIREIGVEDAGALVAAASLEQLVAAFDEDLFRNARPGEREAFDPERFVAWLEVLLEAGDETVAARFSELSEDFVLRAITSLVRVLDHDALRDRMQEEDDDQADAVDKALESSLSTEIDGYLLVSRDGTGWDAVLRLVLALDREHRALLERLFDRAARMSSRLLDDLAALATVLSDSDSLAEDVEAEREARRSAQGFVEPRDARGFLELARRPFEGGERDAITRAYFRTLAAAPVALVAEPAAAIAPSPLLLGDGDPRRGRRGAGAPRVREAFQRLGAQAPDVLSQRLEELLYLANVLSAGASGAQGEHLGAAEAAESALATVALGAIVVGGGDDVASMTRGLLAEPADVLYRRAAAALSRSAPKTARVATLEELGATWQRVTKKPRREARREEAR